MPKVLIIDDEVWMRRGIRSMLEASSYLIEEIQEAGDSEDALRKVQKTEFDVIFADIRMPGLDGLAFIEKALAILPSASFIVVSGYNDFDYAKRAIHLKVVDYLLKPVVKNDLLEAFDKAMHSKKQETAKPTDADQAMLVKSMQKKLIIDLIDGRNDVTRNLSRSLQTDLHKCHFACVSFRVQNFETTIKDKGIAEITLIYYIMSNFMEDMFGEDLGGIVFQHQECVHVVLYNDYLLKDAMATHVHQYVERVFQWVKRLKFFSVQSGVSRLYEHAEGIPRSYQEALTALTYSVFTPNVLVTEYALFMDLEGHVGYSLEIEKELYHQVILTNRTGITDTVSLLIERAFSHVQTPKALRQLLEMCWLLGERWLIENVEHSPLPISYREFQTNPLKYDNLDHMKRALADHFYTLSLALNKKTSTDGKKAIGDMMAYIQKHYNEEISLTQLAGQLFMNATYLSDLFKEVTGMSFVSYITSIRMKKACDYLKHREIKINQIAALVGFEDERYFSTVFKKNYGMTPREFRNQGL